MSAKELIPTVQVVWQSNNMKNLIISIIMFFVGIGIVYVIESGVEKHEKSECIKWKIQANEVGPEWFAAQWQLDQCARYSIPLQ